MRTEISWNEDNQVMDLPTDEFKFYREVSGVLASLKAPNRAIVDCPYGTAVFDIIKRSGTAFVREDTNNISFPDTGEYPEVYLTCINPAWNNYKFYRLTPQGDNVIATYGRIGADKGELFGERTYTYPKHMFWVKYQEKLAKGYIDQSKVYLAQRTATAKASSTAGTSAGTSKPETAADVLYRTLRSYAKKHVEAVCVSSAVTQAMVDTSRKYLDTLYKRKTVDAFNNTLLKLLAVAPRKVRRVADLLANTPSDFAAIIGREEGLVSAMEALVSDPAAVSASNEGFRDVEVFYATDKQKKQVMERLSSQLHNRVKQIYRVIPNQQQRAFDAYIKQNGIKAIKQLWHGSRNENWLSIIQNGLKLRPDAVITGKMFGDGIYFAPSSMKSWNYTSFYGTTWAHGTSNKGFMALYATAYGNPVDVYSSQRFTQTGLGNKNSVHAHAGQSLLNDEIVFYTEAAMVLNYIVEFES